MRSFIRSMIVAASVASVGCGSAGDVGTQRAALTSTDVDVAPECQGVLDFANTASFAELDAYLPSNAANNIIGQRSVAPFTTLAELLAVDQVGDYRLTQIHQGALAGGWITSSCVGIFDRLAVSADDAQAMVALVNTISSSELHAILPNAWNGAVNLLALRPFTRAEDISSTSGIGPVSLRSIRNAATLSRPFEQLAAAVNALRWDVTILRHFDWYAALQNQGRYQLRGMSCFGVDPDLIPNGAEIRPNLATPAEVLADVRGAVSFANRYNQLTIDPAIGLANLEQQLAGRTFFGCYIEYSNDPWSGNNQAFFVDPRDGFGVLTETRWSE